MDIKETILRPQAQYGSGLVRKITLEESGTTVTQITTFCPDRVGPGATHLYLIEAGELILVDSGLPTNLIKPLFFDAFHQPMPSHLAGLPQNLSLEELDSGLKLAGYALEDIDLLVLTHGHWDHFMQGRAVLERSQGQVTAHLQDTPKICNPWALLLFWESRRDEARVAGMPSPPPVNRGMIDHLGAEVKRLSLEIDQPLNGEGPLPQNRGGSVVESVNLPGHSPGSVGLLVGPQDGDRLLISGDVILSPISPIPVDLLPYLSTLIRLRDMEGVVLTLPAHGQEIQDLRGRAAFLLEHHHQRLKKTFLACARPVSAWQVAIQKGYYDVVVSPDEFNLLAGREAFAHLDLLRSVNLVELVDIKDGCQFFRAAKDDFEAGWELILKLAEA